MRDSGQCRETHTHACFPQHVAVVYPARSLHAAGRAAHAPGRALPHTHTHVENRPTVARGCARDHQLLLLLRDAQTLRPEQKATMAAGGGGGGDKRGLEHLDEYEPKPAKHMRSLHDRMADRRLVVILEGATLETVKVKALPRRWVL